MENVEKTSKNDTIHFVVVFRYFFEGGHPSTSKFEK